jgi:hypothetical protein
MKQQHEARKKEEKNEKWTVAQKQPPMMKRASPEGVFVAAFVI